MPTSDDIRKRQDARRLRKEAQQGHVDRAHSEAVTQAEASAQNEAGKAPADPSNTGPGNAQTAVVAARASANTAKRGTRAEQKLAAKRQTEVQARRDGERSAPQVDVEAELNRWDGTGSPPLHLLNAVAIRHDAELRDEGKDIASAAARGAYETYLGKSAVKRDRHARMRAQIAAGEAQIASRANTQND